MSDVFPDTNFTEPYLTTQEAADQLRLSPRTLEKMRVQGNGPFFHKFGRRVRYDPSDLKSWATARRMQMTSEQSSIISK